MLNANFVILAGIINLIGSVSYIIEVLKGRVKPNKVTWLLWGVAPTIAFLAQILQGVGISAFLTFTIGFGPILILGASFINKKSYWKISKFDIFCGSVSLLALIIWILTKDANTAIFISILADFFAALPTVIKAWNQPETEDYKAFLATVIASTITLLTIVNWNFATLSIPIYTLLICAYFTLVVIFPKFRPFSRAELKL